MTNFLCFPGSSRTSFRGRCSKSPFRYPLMSLSRPSHVPPTPPSLFPFVSHASITRLSHVLHAPLTSLARPSTVRDAAVLATASHGEPVRPSRVPRTSAGHCGYVTRTTRGLGGVSMSVSPFAHPLSARACRHVSMHGKRLCAIRVRTFARAKRATPHVPIQTEAYDHAQ